MSLDEFFDTNFGGNIPWMAETDVDKAVELDVRLESIKVIGSKVPWRTDKNDLQAEVECEMRDIQYADGDLGVVADDGLHVVPFWAADPFKDCIKASGSRKGWIKLVYKRNTHKDISKWDGEKKDYNDAAFAERE